jgi:hypothetical protein
METGSVAAGVGFAQAASTITAITNTLNNGNNFFVIFLSSFKIFYF